MPEIIPAIIAKSFEALEEKIKLVEPFVKTVQLDVMDGIFVSNKTWPFAVDAAQNRASIGDLNKLKTDLFLEAHLMIENPHRVLNEWLAGPVQRVILHWEAVEKIHNHELLPYKTQISQGFPISNLAEEIHRSGKELGIALNLETPLSVLDNFINEIDAVLLMGVNPGLAGQQLQLSIIVKIEQLRRSFPNVKIEVDGGVGEKNINDLIRAGANFLVVGSGIFGTDDPIKAICELNDQIGYKK